MNEFVIHSVPGSPFGRTVMIALEEKYAPYRLSAVAPESLREPEHLARQLGDSDFFVGNSITLADILLARHLNLFRELPEWPGLTEITPSLCAWLDPMNQRASSQATTWENTRGYESRSSATGRSVKRTT